VLRVHYKPFSSLKVEKSLQLLGVTPPDSLKSHTTFMLCPLCMPGLESPVTTGNVFQPVTTMLLVVTVATFTPPCLTMCII